MVPNGSKTIPSSDLRLKRCREFNVTSDNRYEDMAASSVSGSSCPDAYRWSLLEGTREHEIDDECEKNNDRQ